MKVLPADVEAVFDVTFAGETALDVALRVFDVTTPDTPVQVALAAMEHVFYGTYVGRFTPEAGKRYMAQKTVYTDGTFAFQDTDYGVGTEAFYGDSSSLTELEAKVDQLLAQGSGQMLVGVVEQAEVLGFVECN